MKVNYPILPEDIVNERERRKEKKMTEYCCNEPMQATYRYKKGGVLWQSFVCHGCGSKREAQVPGTSYEVCVRCQS